MTIYLVLNQYGTCPSDSGTAVVAAFLDESNAKRHAADLQAKSDEDYERTRAQYGYRSGNDNDFDVEPVEVLDAKSAQS